MVRRFYPIFRELRKSRRVCRRIAAYPVPQILNSLPKGCTGHYHNSHEFGGPQLSSRRASGFVLTGMSTSLFAVRPDPCEDARRPTPYALRRAK
jgi:hypothetical protein